jgi:hypothetical protein
VAPRAVHHHRSQCAECNGDVPSGARFPADARALRLRCHRSVRRLPVEPVRRARDRINLPADRGLLDRARAFLQRPSRVPYHCPQDCCFWTLVISARHDRHCAICGLRALHPPALGSSGPPCGPDTVRRTTSRTLLGQRLAGGLACEWKHGETHQVDQGDRRGGTPEAAERRHERTGQERRAGG